MVTGLMTLLLKSVGPGSIGDSRGDCRRWTTRQQTVAMLGLDGLGSAEGSVGHETVTQYHTEGRLLAIAKTCRPNGAAPVVVLTHKGVMA